MVIFFVSKEKSDIEEKESVARAKVLVAEREYAFKSFMRSMQPQLECPGCKSPFEDPRVLDCSHTYCKHCIALFAKKAKTGKNSSSISCPECSMQTEIPDGDISQLPYNFSIQHVMDLMTYYSSPDPVPLIHCGNCRRYKMQDLAPAIARCSSCSSFLCKECYELHSMDDFTKLHTTLSLTERRSSDYFFSCLTPDDTGINNCKKHNWKPYTHFCITCSKGVCERCLRQDHKLHVYSKPEDLRPEYTAYAKQLMSRTTRLLRQTEAAIKTTQDLMSGIQLLAATQIEEVIRMQETLTSTLDARQSLFLQGVEKYQQGRKTCDYDEHEDGTSG